MSWFSHFFVVSCLCGLIGCQSIDYPPDVQLALDKTPDAISYNLQIKPILSDKCFACHGPDKAKQKAGLRLDQETAYDHLTENGQPAINPGKPGKSDVVNRILSSDADLVMPTTDSHLSLSAAEKALLIRWIDEGATYEPHWALQKPRLAEAPSVKNENWVRGPIDQFVLARLESEGLKPSPEANRETLIRRVSFDLTGLPPTLPEIDQFVTDRSADAYERMVDRYLKSPHYGERMASYWLDLARFADSHGYLDDKHRDHTPWRDWVISAFNRNLPYDRFVTWQLAGDLLPGPDGGPATKEQILATGFNRNNKQNSEAGIVEEEFRTEYVADRTNTFGKAFLGLTMECARCHDHKYDPISQKNYYQLFAFFNSTFENGSANYGGSDIVPGPTLLLTSAQTDQKISQLKAHIRQYEMDKPVATLTDKPLNPAQVKAALDRKTTAYLPFDKRLTTDKKQQFENRRDAKQPAIGQSIDLVPGRVGQAIKLNAESQLNLPKFGPGFVERTDPFAVSLWLNVPKVYDKANVFYHTDSWRYGTKGYDLMLFNNRLTVRLMHAWPHDAISVVSQEPLSINQWHHVAVSYDGSSRAAGVRLFVDGQAVALRVERDHLQKTIRHIPNIHLAEAFRGFSLGMRALDRSLPGGMVDELRLFNDELTPAEVQWLAQKPISAPNWADFLANQNPLLQPQKQTLRNWRVQVAALLDSAREVMVMGDLPKPRPTYVLKRGVYDSYGEAVSPDLPTPILPFDPKLPRNRLGLAKWLFSPGNPLTARVAVNRFWGLIFGRGLVKTTDDFGNQGELPSHPELLSYLSVWFETNGWNVKALQRQILLSATYRQASTLTDDLLERDPDNKWLARGPRARLTAEMIRDNALCSSGLLVRRVGGASVYPFQPDGLWEAISDKVWRYRYVPAQGEGLYRRSVYTVWKRTSPPPSMLIFDAPDRSICTVKRAQSNSPLQSLVLLNDPQFVEAARLTAVQMMQANTPTPEGRIQHGFRLLTSRRATPPEMAVLLRLFRDEQGRFSQNPLKTGQLLATGYTPVPPALNKPELAAYSVVASAIMNTDAFIVKP